MSDSNTAVSLPERPLAPVTGGERVEALDVLRGFALLGILLMNIEAFVGPLNAALSGLDPALTGADAWVDGSIYLLVQGKFYTLFSLLFGAGFAVMMERAEVSGRGFGGLYLRRLTVLAALGMIHMVLIWSGDILFTYALLGALMLLLFRRTPIARLPTWGLVVYLLPSLFMFAIAGMVFLGRLTPEGAAEIDKAFAGEAEKWQAIIDAQRHAVGPEGSFAEATAQRWADFQQILGYLPFWGPTILGMFLIGAWFWRSGALSDSRGHEMLWRRLRFWGFVLGLPLLALAFRLTPTVELFRLDFVTVSAGLFVALGNLALCLAYAATLVLALHGPVWRDRLSILAPAGRMALTNYLLQSLVCVGIFYGYGLGYFEALPRAWQPVFVLLLFAAQVLFSRWWLERFRFGPVEWLWRWATYGQRPPMRA